MLEFRISFHASPVLPFVQSMLTFAPQFLWHFCSITARVLALSLFASVLPQWIGPLCAAHWLVMASWIVSQRTAACNTQCEEFLFALVLGSTLVCSAAVTPSVQV